MPKKSKEAGNNKIIPDLAAPSVLFYETPANEWTCAIPLGNGRIGAMLFGDPRKDRLQVNEESLWGGMRLQNDNPLCLSHLDEIRKKLIRGDIRGATMLADECVPGNPGKLGSYQVLADIFFGFRNGNEEAKNYRRSLDLAAGIASVSFERRGNAVSYSVFASAPDDAVVIRFEAEKIGGIDMKIEMHREKDAAFRAGDASVIMEGQVSDEHSIERGPGGAHMRFCAVLRVTECDGRVSCDGDAIAIEDAKSAMLIFTAATDYNIHGLDLDRSLNPLGICTKIIEKAERKPFIDLKAGHEAEHRSIFERVRFSLECDPALDSMPTDTRLSRFREKERDPGLFVLYFQFGRYLLMGSSRRPARLPANLQGIWNKDIEAPWCSDYHVNINLQMNYWPAEVTNLSETVEPLVDFIEQLTVPGSVTAKTMYGAQGWTMHHTTDVFGKTGVIDGVHWGMFPMGGPWMTIPLWEHFEFSEDPVYLKTRAYPVMKGACEFILSFLFEDENGTLCTAPSYSPENSYIDPKSGREERMTHSPAMDIQIIREVFANFKKAAEILRTDEALVRSIDEALERLPRNRTASNGTLMEWIAEYEEAEPGHRHISHLFGLHPGSQITMDTPELFEAARKTLARRIAHGCGRTGWSMAWIVNLYARLYDGENAYKHLAALLANSTLPNLFDTHPPFQIDGNFGGTAGIAEMLLQSRNGILRILPALPKAWRSGSISGLRCRGNITVDIEWKAHRLTEVRLLTGEKRKITVEYGKNRIEAFLEPDEVLALDGSLSVR